MTSKIQIWNMALGYLGTRTVASETERTPEAIQCGLYWDVARRAALRGYPWRWAQRRARLAEKDVPELYAREWRYAYTVPDKFLRLHRVATDGDRTGKPRWMLVSMTDGTPLILSDIPQAVADYTVDVEDVSRWDDAFVKAMSLRLACEIAGPLLKNNGAKVQELEQRYQLALPAAYDGNTNDNNPPKREDPWITARSGCAEDWR